MFIKILLLVLIFIWLFFEVRSFVKKIRASKKNKKSEDKSNNINKEEDKGA